MANIYYSGTSCVDGSPIEIISVEGLETGKTYQDFNLNCVSLTYSASTTGETNTTFLYGPFDDCTECNAPISAGTEYNICVLDCSGNTISISPPHPTYTNEFGKAVIQLDSIELGGYNGLNN
jgi:hypothetical protein